ncbi:hypothetical protein PPIS_a2319 [Pseudoalteromonas piscicida]|uniref:Uncharacterized protein n=1 Tax=Pseudoalteromonas piscicida TaxID=43662 RepID=A0ABN5CIY8_PSEO7|nr:hypothetical protein PPIS_a2319 [Pseudoalteromonas piscicida]
MSFAKTWEAQIADATKLVANMLVLNFISLSFTRLILPIAVP